MRALLVLVRMFGETIQNLKRQKPMSETRRINIEADDPRSHIVNVCSPTTLSEAS